MVLCSHFGQLTGVSGGIYRFAMPTIPLNPEGGHAATVFARVPSCARQSLDAIAETQGVSVATVVRTAVEQYLALFDLGRPPSGPPGKRRRLRVL